MKHTCLGITPVYLFRYVFICTKIKMVTEINKILSEFLKSALDKICLKIISMKSLFRQLEKIDFV